MTQIRKCKVCGCTETNACDNGCYWIAKDLCSNCGTKKKTEKQNRAWLKIKIGNFLYRIDHPNAYGSMKKVETLAKDLEEILKTLKKNI